jgi:integrase
LNEIVGSLFSETVKKPITRERKTKVSTVRTTAHRWLSESDGIAASTRNRYRGILEIFEVYSENAEVTEINRKLALGFMEYLKTTPSQKTGQLLSHRSLSAYQICLASYWSVLDYWGLVDGDMRNPFSGLLKRIAGQKKKIDPRKKILRPVTRKEAECLLRYISGNQFLKYQNEMYIVVRLLWVTACRLNEIASLSLRDIADHGDHIRLVIKGAKTEAGNRLVVVVGKGDCELLREAIRHARITEPVSIDNHGLLFPRLLRGGYDKKLGHYLGKALEKARKRQPTSNEWDMHSFRRAGVSALVNAGVARGERNLAVGHSNKDDIGLSVYAENGDLSEIIKSTFEAMYDKLGGNLRVSFNMTNNQ